MVKGYPAILGLADETAEMKVDFPVALVVGNETTGVSKEVLETADEIVEIPMFGVNVSLNVMVSLAIVLYKVVGNSKRY